MLTFQGMDNKFTYFSKSTHLYSSNFNFVHLRLRLRLCDVSRLLFVARFPPLGDGPETKDCQQPGQGQIIFIDINFLPSPDRLLEFRRRETVGDGRRHRDGNGDGGGQNRNYYCNMPQPINFQFLISMFRKKIFCGSVTLRQLLKNTCSLKKKINMPPRNIRSKITKNCVF